MNTTRHNPIATTMITTIFALAIVAAAPRFASAFPADYCCDGEGNGCNSDFPTMYYGTDCNSVCTYIAGGGGRYSCTIGDSANAHITVFSDTDGNGVFMFGNDGTSGFCCEDDDFASYGLVKPIEITTTGQADYVKATWSVGGWQWEEDVIADLGDCDDGPYCDYVGSDYDTDCGWDTDAGEHPCDNVDVGIGAWIVHAGAGDDQIRVSTDTDTCTTAEYYGEDGNDKIMGGRADAHHYGGAGNDVIYGFYGDDYIEGGTGSDWIDGGPDVDEIYGNYMASGYDVADSSDDYMCGGTSMDEVYGGNGDSDECGNTGDSRYYCTTVATCEDLSEEAWF